MEIYRRSAIVLLGVWIMFPGVSSVSANEISGRIRIEPPYPEAKLMKVHKKRQDSCAEEQLSQARLVSSEGGVANVVLWLEGEFSAQGGSASGGETQSQPPQSVTLDQMRCNFEPHVVLIPPGGRLEVINSDPLAHDVRAFEDASMLFRLDMDTHAKPQERQFEKPGIYTIRCGLHPWMHAFAVQAAHSFYGVTDAKGVFRLQEVPEGKHRIHIWHETLGEAVLPVEIHGNVTGVSYVFNKKA